MKPYIKQCQETKLWKVMVFGPNGFIVHKEWVNKEDAERDAADPSWTGNVTGEDYDELVFVHAVKIVASEGKASLSTLQRRLNINAHAALTAIERMKKEGLKGDDGKVIFNQFSHQHYSEKPCFYDFLDGSWEIINCCSRTAKHECCFKEKGETWEVCKGGKQVAEWFKRLVNRAIETGKWEVM